MKIYQLGDNLINKIAAGEVIERPASAVKELIENSIDANATTITVEVKDGGTTLIRITDDGEGIAEDDIELAITRHATSKILSDNDLFAIKTLGFRGEALASIASVSRLRITTHTKDTDYAIEIKAENGRIQDQYKVGSPVGTIIEITDLFYNTPARRKHLSSVATELNHVANIVQRYALIYHDIHFKLISNEKPLYESIATPDLFNNITSIYGTEIAKNLIKLEGKNDLFYISGYISKPSMTRGGKDQQSLFINKRFVKSKTITQAIYDAYHTMLFHGRHPIIILDISIDHTKVDVNVHPTKEVVRIEQEDELYSFVKDIVKEALLNADLTSDFIGFQFGSNSQAKNKYSFSTEVQTPLRIKEAYAKTLNDSTPATQDFSNLESWQTESNLIPNATSRIKESNKITPTLTNISIPNKKISGIFSPFRILGQFNDTYIIAENAQGLLVIDQHAAQERVNFERLSAQYKDKGIRTQTLITPQIIELSLSDSITIQNNLKLLFRLGFNIEEYGGNTFAIRSIPAIFERYYNNLIFDLLQELSVSKKEIDTIKEKRIIRFACRKSIKAGQKLTIPYMQTLIEELGQAEKPYTCPHGRPTILTMSVSDLEKRFKRQG